MKKGFYFKVIGNIIFYLILIVFVIISFSMLRANRLGKQPELMGYKFFVILSGSMSPNIEAGDLIIVKDVPLKEIQVNDVITFGDAGNNVLTTHRVKEIINDKEVQFATQGDANNTKDFYLVKRELVQGKVVTQVPKVGTLIKYVKENLLTIVLVIIVISIIIIIAPNFHKKIRTKNSEGL